MQSLDKSHSPHRPFSNIFPTRLLYPSFSYRNSEATSMNQLPLNFILPETQWIFWISLLICPCINSSILYLFIQLISIFSASPNPVCVSPQNIKVLHPQSGIPAQFPHSLFNHIFASNNQGYVMSVSDSFVILVPVVLMNLPT